jgi:hypothetical protein
MAGPGKPGRPSKGPRKKFSISVPEDLVSFLDAEAEQRGLDRIAVIVEMLGNKYGRPTPTRQETLPLSDAA